MQIKTLDKDRKVCWTCGHCGQVYTRESEAHECCDGMEEKSFIKDNTLYDWSVKEIIKKGYVAMNKGEFHDLTNITFLNNLKEAKKWKGQEILEVEIRFKRAVSTGNLEGRK